MSVHNSHSHSSERAGSGHDALSSGNQPRRRNTMHNSNDPINQTTAETRPPLPPAQVSAEQPDARKSPLDPLKTWMATLAIPVPFTFGALVLAAFLLFPAYKGLTSG